MKMKKVGKSKKVDSARKAPKRILKDAHRPNHPLFDKHSKWTMRDIRRMEADYISQNPSAVITNIPEKAYHDPISAKQLQYDNAEIMAIMAPDYELGKGQRKFNSYNAKKRANDKAPELKRRNEIIIKKALEMEAWFPKRSVRDIANRLSNDHKISIGFEQIRKIIRPALKK